MTLSPEQVRNEEYKKFDPETHHVEFHDDGSATVTLLPYWNDESYAAWQGDPFDGDGPPDAGIYRTYDGRYGEIILES